MPTVEGNIRTINVYETFCCVKLLKTDDSVQYLLLWSYPTQEDNATNRLLHGMYLALARDAHIHDRRVSLTHASGSALITAFIAQ